MSDIDKEINELAEKMVKSTTASKDLLLDTVMELGPEGLKKALPALNDGQKEVLKDFLDDLSKAVSMDDAYTPKKTETSAQDLKTESQTGSDDEDEKLMKEKAAQHKHQGDDTPEGKEGQVIKGCDIKKGEDEKKEESAKEKIADAVDDLAEEEVKEHEKEMHKSVSNENSEEQEMNLEEMLKSMSDADMTKMMYKMANERKLEKSEIFKALSEKGVEESKLEKCFEAMEKVQKSVEEQSSEEDLEKGKMKEKMMDEESKEEEKEESVEKSIVYAPKNLLAAKTLGRNAHYSVEEEIFKSHETLQERIEKGAVFINEDPQDEKMEKSEDAEKREDLNDLIEKSMDTTWKDIEGVAAQEAAEKAKNGQLQKSFEDEDMLKSLGISEEEAAKILGE